MAMDAARIEWLLDGGPAFKVGALADGRIEVACVLAADIRSEMVCEAARRLRQGNLVVELLGGGRLAVSEKPADAWLAPPVVEDDEDEAALSPVTSDIGDDEDTIVDQRPPAGMEVWDPSEEEDEVAPESDPDCEFELARERRAARYECGVSL